MFIKIRPTNSISESRSLTPLFILKIFVFSVWFFGFLFFIFGFTQAQTPATASLYFLPDSGSFEVGKIISVRFAVNTGNNPINLVEATLSFSKNLEVTSFSKNGSIISLWFNEPSFSNTDQTIYFSGGIPNPGFTGIGRLLIINFKAKSAGSAWIRVSSAQVLANDGFGTNILKESGSANFVLYETGLPKPSQPGPIKEEISSKIKIFSSTHPDQNKWYKEKNIILSWTWQPTITDYSYLLDQKTSTIPDNIGEGLVTSTAYLEVSEGIWYFHLKAKTSAGWGETSHFKIQIDNTPPSFLKISSDQGQITFNPSPTLRFETKDELSGIDYFAVKINEGEFVKTKENFYQIPKQKPGNYQITVRAYDLAGNYLEENFVITIESIPRPVITYWTKEILIGETIGNLNIFGIGPDKAKIKFFLIHENGEQKIKETEVSQGKWRLSLSELLPAGKYRGYAIASIEGEESLPSSEIEFKVIKTGLRFLFWIIRPEMIWEIIVALICAVGILLTLYLGVKRKFKKCDTFVRKILARKDKGVKIKIEERNDSVK